MLGLEAGADAEPVGDPDRDRGVEVDRLQLALLRVVAADPVVGIGRLEAEWAGDPEAEADTVADQQHKVARADPVVVRDVVGRIRAGYLRAGGRRRAR